ncbi:hypothetical protein PQX77_005558 [Marasmius sp. AFHP31]|nr:hypothetical protein PQX77_005558 [Marasmius sp. AFHP31]
MDMRRRVPFKFASAAEDESENVVLDEQEQDELIQKLRDENNQSNKWYEFGAVGILSLSGLLHLIYLINPSNDPLSFTKSNGDSRTDPGVPLPRLFTLLNLFLHLNLFLLLNPRSLPFLVPLQQTRLHFLTHQHASHFPFPLSLPLSFVHTYTLALVVPAICVFIRTTYTTIFWWCETAVVGFVIQAVQEAILKGDEGIEGLVGMKYHAPGA